MPPLRIAVLPAVAEMMKSPTQANCRVLPSSEISTPRTTRITMKEASGYVNAKIRYPPLP